MAQEKTSPQDNHKLPAIILLGAPGSGKGTQAADIVRRYGVIHISTGDMFRYHIKNRTPIGKIAKEHIDQGHLVPDSVVIDMLKDRLDKEDCKTHGILLDGFPRTVEQAKALEPLLKDRYDLVVVSLEVSDDTVVKRITGRRSCPSCGCIYHIIYNPPKQDELCDTCKKPLVTRDDDTEKTVRERLAVFHSQTAPVKEFYTKNGLLFEVNGEQSPEAVGKECLSILQKKYPEAAKQESAQK